MMQISPVLSIIIVTYKSKTVLGPCLKSIDKYNDLGDKLEVIVVDNSPPEDDTYGYIKQKFPEVTLIKNIKNNGFGEGNNVGVRQAQGVYLAFLNPDIELITPVFKKAITAFTIYPEVSAVGFTLITPDKNLGPTYGLLPEVRKSIISKLWLKWALGKFDIFSEGIYPWGANLFVRKCDFIHAGLFDENIFLNYEEADLMRRLPSTKTLIFKEKIIHLEGHSKPDFALNLENYLQSEQYYFNKHQLDYKGYQKKFISWVRVKKQIKRCSPWESALCEIYTRKQ
jgi:GT2 family glycosyltransferase